MSLPTSVALDLGTTAAKAAVFDAAGRRLETFRIELSLHRLPAGGVEQDPGEILEAARKLLSRASHVFPRRAPWVSCGMACQRSTLGRGPTPEKQGHNFSACRQFFGPMLKLTRIT